MLEKPRQGDSLAYDMTVLGALMTGKKPLVLCADDEPDIRRLVTRILSEAGYPVITARDGQQTLELVKGSHAALVVLDIKMPGLSGEDILKAIAAEYPEIAVVIISGIASLSTVINTLKTGAYDYLIKPFEPDELVKAIEKALEKQQIKISERDRNMGLEKLVIEQQKLIDQKNREISGLNFLLQLHLKHSFEVDDIYGPMADDMLHIASQFRELINRAIERKKHLRTAMEEVQNLPESD